MTPSYTTRSREFGEILFIAPAATDADAGYVWIETDHGRRGQICEGGVFRGSAVTSTAPDLQATARRWLRQRRDWMRREKETY